MDPSDTTYQPYVSEGSVLSRDVINTGARRDGGADAMINFVSANDPRISQSGFQDISELNDPNLISASLANENDIFKQFDLDDVVSDINNGRIKDATKVAENAVSQEIFNDIVIHRDNQANSVKGIVEENALSTYFFSKMNTDIIQDTIRYRVYQDTNNVISKQSENELFIVMRSILLQYGNFRSGFQELKDEIVKLNQLVVDYCAEFVSANVLQHTQYVQELERLPQPINFPESTREFNYTYDTSNLL
tara:strand:- start:1783 stop:2529 length:747 start_codon:yes stop_codon:yes gene_type:complete